MPTDLLVPPNLFFTGTVNVDETTYMFSPKVLSTAHSSLSSTTSISPTMAYPRKTKNRPHSRSRTGRGLKHIERLPRRTGTNSTRCAE